MTTSSMHFGPEWMRAKQPTSAGARPYASSSPPPATTASNAPSNGTPAPPGASSYSSLVTPPPAPAQLKRDVAHPFKYSRDEMLQVWKDGGGSGALPIEVERWEVVKEEPGEPVSLHEYSETEKKLYATSLSSESRRRQSTDYASQAERSKPYSLSIHGGTLGNGLRRRRGDSTGTDHPPLTLQRKSSNSLTPALMSPRSRLGGSGNGFDGVLNGSDNAWSNMKRRMSVGQPPRVDETPEALNKPGIKEEEANIISSETPLKSSESTFSDTTNRAGVGKLATEVGALSLNSSAEQRTESTTNNGTVSNAMQSNAVPPEKVEWNYIDFQDNTQGPFTGEMMQAWYEGQFFTDELKMKRANIDAEFMTLAEIKRRARGERIFLSPLANQPLVPPGLGHPTGSGFNSLLQRTGVLDGLRQPAPLAYGRSSTLDTNFSMSSAASSSASPSSSLGGNFGRTSISPDHTTLGNRGLGHRFSSDVPLNGRVSAGSFTSNGSSVLPHSVRHTLNDGLQGPERSMGFGSQPSSPWPSSQVNGFQGWNGPSGYSQANLLPQFENGGASVLQPSLAREASYQSGWAAPGDSFVQRNPVNGLYQGLGERDEFSRGLTQHLDDGMLSQGLAHADEPYSLGFQQTNLPILSTRFSHEFDHASSPVAHSPSSAISHVQQQLRQPTSPWVNTSAQESSIPRPFDADRSMASNSFVPTLSTLTQHSAWNRPHTDIHNQPGPNEWSSAQQPITASAWNRANEEKETVAVADAIQHDDRYQAAMDGPGKVVVEDSTIGYGKLPEAVLPVTSTKPEAHLQPKKPATPHETTPEKKKGAVATSSTTTQRKDVGPPITDTILAPPQAPKPAWGAGDDTKLKQHAAPAQSLREIQEAETRKKQEAHKPETRKLTEKDRERSARATASPATEEKQFVTSWGLPTSQVSVRSNGTSTAKETSTPSPSQSQPAAPVWTSAAKTAAKTMKEILEEEERQKLRAAKKQETAATAAKRAAVTTPVKVPPVAQNGGAWTVVGSGGKPGVSSVTTPTRPGTASQTSTPASDAVPRPSPAAAPRSTNSSQVAKAVNNPPAKTDDWPIAPSPEFMQWMRKSLQGLNSSVSFEEIAKMLLSFPLDPDPLTVEIIAETVYGASTTLNGRQFASEFVAKRKVDAASAPKSSQGGAVNGNLPSLADIVKAPKTAQNSDFGYKVVKKKGKASR